MTFVVDASVTICWLMPDERHPVAAAALLKMASEPVVVPGIWWFETRNILLVNERRGRLDGSKTAQAFKVLGQLPITVDTNVVEEQLIRLARHYRLTVYDAAYLELALRRGHALATLGPFREQSNRFVCDLSAFDVAEAGADSTLPR